MINILVTGGNGQLATCLKDIEGDYSDFNVIYTDFSELDITDMDQVNSFFTTTVTFDYCINCAAYTAVDNAEKDQEKAFEINTFGAKNLALACKANNVVLIHISTDFVFDGKKQEPYIETDDTNPISIYGATKLKGEIEIKQILEKYFIIRTSWLYSEHGANFMKTMLRLAKSNQELSIVSDQIGTPTYAGDLAKVIFHIISIKSQDYGFYHYSNLGEISWYDFAKAVFDESNINIKLTPINTDAYPTFASRPKYSALNKNKISKKLNIEIPHWEHSLRKAILNYNQ